MFDVMQLRSSTVLAVVMILSVTACGGSGGSTTTVEMALDEHSEEFHFGEPAEAATADRTVEVAANDSLTFDPVDIMVVAGETITFRITNTGNLAHDFTLGDQETQDAHEAEMVEMMENGEMTMHDEANAISLPAGETKELTWHFSEAGTFLIGCHVTGHYAAGMKSTVKVES